MNGDEPTTGEPAVAFRVRHEFEATPRELWDELVDWEGHGAWVPMTRTDVDSDDPTAVGATFTAYTGIWRLALVDRMRVAECEWDDATSTGRCVVDKLGPVLSGQAGFDVKPSAAGSSIEWFEAVDVRYLPRMLAPVATKLGAFGFGQGMRRLAKLLADRPPR
jgi:Polyketide cyclase / dehydrase and lipid transport